MTITDVLHRPAAPPRARRKASTSDREAAEFIAYPERKSAALARALSREIAGEVRFSSGDRALYATDGLTGRKTQHVAEVMADALGVLPPPPPPRAPDRQFAAAVGVLALGLVIGATLSAAPLFRGTRLQLRAASVR